MKISFGRLLASFTVAVSFHAPLFAAQNTLPSWLRPSAEKPSLAKAGAIQVKDMKQWATVLGGVQGDRGRGIAITEDGGVLVVGETDSFNAEGSDIWAVRLDADGKVVWQKKYGWKLDEKVSRVLRGSDGNYLIAGRTQSFCPDPAGGGYACYDLFLIKINGNGNLLWKKVTKLHRNLGVLDLIETANGGYAMAGYLRRNENTAAWDLWMLKFADNGDTQWSKVYSLDGLDGYNGGGALTQTQDNGYAFAATAQGFFPNSITQRRNFWVLRLTPTGAVDWQRIYGGSGDDSPQSIRQTSDLGFLLTGNTTWSEGNATNGGRVMKIDYYGNVVWQKDLGEKAGPDILRPGGTDDGVVAGAMLDSPRLGWLARMNGSGQYTWQKTYRLQGHHLYIHDLVKTPEGGWAAVATAEPVSWGGYRNDQIVVLRMNGSGNLGDECLSAGSELTAGTTLPQPGDLQDWGVTEPEDFDVSPLDMDEDDTPPVVATTTNESGLSAPNSGSSSLPNSMSLNTGVLKTPAMAALMPFGEDTISTPNYLCN